ncbi:hypothetical protein HY638_01165 [Candidatus Woesearchaeota archaeon]|nr:hypothetical protein [Candidatus Woesearchaeota archaeon]
MEPVDIAKFGFGIEKDEETRNGPTIPTGYPKPLVRYKLYIEGFNISVEEPYFWVLDYLRYFHGYPYIDKITDVFSAAENSAFFGAAQQRLGAQQDKVSQFLATIGKMVKEIFQLVRELRILDERLGYYADSYANSRSRESAEITLKGIWVDMVEQGAKNPASVYGMAREVQFTTLPDLFFSTHPFQQEDVDEVVERERGQFNRKVREVLKRKLRAYLAWKEHTYEELKNRRKFTLKYLRQHYEIIKMYMAWAKPYLKNIRRLTLDQNKVDTADLVVAFETSMIEIEILARKPVKDTGINEVVLMHYLYRTRPEMSYSQEYQRGPVHVGRVMIDFRAYVWSDDEIKKYRSMRDEEEFRLLEVIDSSIKAAMDAMGDELMKYLKEAGEDIGTLKPKETPPKYYGPLSSILKGFSTTFRNPKPSKPKVDKNKAWKQELARKEADPLVRKATWGTYHHFKKHHGMLNWGR